MGLKKKKKIEEEGYEGLDEEDLEEEDVAKKPAAKVKRRFAIFAQEQRLGIVDTETKDIIAEGEYAVLEVLGNILERLERMETTIGSLIE